MNEQDTVKLLRECDAGTKMGIASIDEVLDCVSDSALRDKLIHSKNEHEALRSEIQKQLCAHHEEGKNPNPVAKSMSWVKTNVKLVVNESDATIADLMTDGCNMGVKSLNRYLNQYSTADETSKGFAGRLIGMEETLARDIRCYL